VPVNVIVGAEAAAEEPGADELVDEVSELSSPDPHPESRRETLKETARAQRYPKVLTVIIPGLQYGRSSSRKCR
jgi:hypothetical protein